MATLLAEVNATVEGAIALVSATKTTSPILNLAVLIVQHMAVHFFVLGTAQHFRLYFSTVAASLYPLLTITTETLVAWSGASMLAARQKIPADFPAAPSIFIIGILATLGGRISTAKAILCGAHSCTWRAGPSMTGRIARMRTAFTLSCTGLST